jgi:hypothetical protein
MSTSDLQPALMLDSLLVSVSTCLPTKTFLVEIQLLVAVEDWAVLNHVGNPRDAG